MSTFDANGQIYVFCQRVRNTATYFALCGTELAIFEPMPSGELTFVCMRDTPSTGALIGDTAGLAQYGTDAVASEGWLYVFGFANQPGAPQRRRAGRQSLQAAILRHRLAIPQLCLRRIVGMCMSLRCDGFEQRGNWQLP
jgi:hypothetical protein